MPFFWSMYCCFQPISLLFVKSATVDYVVDCLIPFVAGAHWVLYYVKLVEVGIYIAVSG